MKTNHQRDFVARQDFPSGYRFIRIDALKHYTVRNRRQNERQILAGFVGGLIHEDDVVFAVDSELENPWNWD